MENVEPIRRQIKSERSWKRVFVVEDDLSMSTLLDKALRQVDADAEIDWATSAEEAVFEMNAKTKAYGRLPYDLIIIDVFLEGESTGLEFYELCKNQYPDIPVLVTSALPVGKFLNLTGHHDQKMPFLQKPFSVRECKEAIEAQLHS
jgi:DNA-binding response OmpR family regulator